MNTQVIQVRNLLKYTFTLLPIAAGLDKFTNVLTQWSQYVSEGMANMLPFEPETFMMVVGVIEIIAGVIVFVNTRIGAYIVPAWLFCIALSLIFSWTYIDVAVRDIVMAIAAFSLAKLYESTSVATA